MSLISSKNSMEQKLSSQREVLDRRSPARKEDGIEDLLGVALVSSSISFSLSSKFLLFAEVVVDYSSASAFILLNNFKSESQTGFWGFGVPAN